MRSYVATAVLLLAPSAALAQFKAPPENKGLKVERSESVRMRVGVIIKAKGSLTRVVATCPVPTDWPEQRVSIVNEDVSPSTINLDYRTLPGNGGVKQMVVEIPQLPAGREARALITFQVSRDVIAAPSETSGYSIPSKLDRQLTMNVGASPYIETRHPKIIAAAKQAVAERESAWEKVEAIYDFVRDHVTYKTGELKGASRALYDKEGGADEMASLFIAMCRAQKIPARTIFVLGNCYAEFYLVDDEGQGHWFPCQPAGVRSFGTMVDTSPIVQKGDNFRNPQNPKEPLRFVTEYFTAAGRGKEPQVQFVSELVAE